MHLTMNKLITMAFAIFFSAFSFCSNTEKTIKELAALAKENRQLLQQEVRTSHDPSVKKYGPIVLAFVYAQQGSKK